MSPNPSLGGRCVSWSQRVCPPVKSAFCSWCRQKESVCTHVRVSACVRVCVGMREGDIEKKKTCRLWSSHFSLSFSLSHPYTHMHPNSNARTHSFSLSFCQTNGNNEEKKFATPLPEEGREEKNNTTTRNHSKKQKGLLLKSLLCPPLWSFSVTLIRQVAVFLQTAALSPNSKE